MLGNWIYRFCDTYQEHDQLLNSLDDGNFQNLQNCNNLACIADRKYLNLGPKLHDMYLTRFGAPDAPPNSFEHSRYYLNKRPSDNNCGRWKILNNHVNDIRLFVNVDFNSIISCLKTINNNLRSESTPTNMYIKVISPCQLSDLLAILPVLQGFGAFLDNEMQIIDIHFDDFQQQIVYHVKLLDADCKIIVYACRDNGIFRDLDTKFGIIKNEVPNFEKMFNRGIESLLECRNKLQTTEVQETLEKAIIGHYSLIAFAFLSNNINDQNPLEAALNQSHESRHKFEEHDILDEHLHIRLRIKEIWNAVQDQNDNHHHDNNPYYNLYEHRFDGTFLSGDINEFSKELFL